MLRAELQSGDMRRHGTRRVLWYWVIWLVSGVEDYGSGLFDQEGQVGVKFCYGGHEF